MKKLTPAKIARIRQRREAGESFENLARAFKLSVGTISNALKASASTAGKTKAPRPPAAPATPEGEPLSADDLRRSIAAQVRDLQSDVVSAETPQQRASANRLLVSAQQLLSRLTPPDPDVAPPGMTLVDTTAMEALAATGRDRFLKLVAGVFDPPSPEPT